MRLVCGILCVAAVFVACSCAWAAASPTLHGTSWRLIAIQSMDDAQGTTPVPDPDAFTVTFGADGQASFRLDCNRGVSSWEAKPSGADASGELTFGPIAGTLMMCPQPSLDQRVSAALGQVRGYLVENDRLHLNLLADSGILTWEPIPG